MFQDKTIVCKDCGQEFTFTANEQEFFAEKGLNNSQPTRPSGRVFVFCSGRLRPAKTASRVSAGRRFTFFVYSPAPIAGRIAFVLGFLPRHFLRFDDQRAVR